MIRVPSGTSVFHIFHRRSSAAVAVTSVSLAVFAITAPAGTAGPRASFHTPGGTVRCAYDGDEGILTCVLPSAQLVATMWTTRGARLRHGRAPWISAGRLVSRRWRVTTPPPRKALINCYATTRGISCLNVDFHGFRLDTTGRSRVW